MPKTQLVLAQCVKHGKCIHLESRAVDAFDVPRSHCLSTVRRLTRTGDPGWGIRVGGMTR